MDLKLSLTLCCLRDKAELVNDKYLDGIDRM